MFAECLLGENAHVTCGKQADQSPSSLIQRWIRKSTDSPCGGELGLEGSSAIPWLYNGSIANK